MDASRPVLRLVSPLPPARNGIADYAALLAKGLSAFYAVDHGDADPPPPRVLYQLGNNIDHAFVLRALRRWPGVVTLHDPGLLWLRQQMGEAFLPGLMAPAGSAQARLAARRGRQLSQGEGRQQENRQGEGLGRADHLLFDQANEVLAASRAVVVHSRFAAARLRALHGEAATRHVTVIPHMVPSVPVLTRAAARAALGLPQAGFILGSAGFAHPGKRFDWLLAAMAQARAAGAEFRYIHAGADDPALPLSGVLGAAGQVTGWLSAAALDLHIAACDALVCLHFPSHGESSGVLARGLALGVGCLVADTAACAELPRDAVLHLPVPNAVPALAAAIVALVANPALAWTLGAAGRRYAERELALPVVVARYREVIEHSLARVPATRARGDVTATLHAPGDGTVKPCAQDDAPVNPYARGDGMAKPRAPADTAVKPRAQGDMAVKPRAQGDATVNPHAQGDGMLVLPVVASATQVAAALAPVHGQCRLLLAAPDLTALAALTLTAPALLHRLLPPWASVSAVRVQEPPGQPGLLLDLLLP